MQKREIETLKSDKLKKTVIPLGLATLFVFVMILMGPSQDTGDDAFIAWQLSRGFGSIASFISPYLSLAISTLYSTIPQLAWWSIFHVFSAWVLLWVCLYIIIKKFKGIQRWGISIIIIAATWIGIVKNVNFTRTAAAFAMAGGMLILDFLLENRVSLKINKVGSFILGLILICLGSMTRFQAALLVFPFLGICIVWIEFYEKDYCFKSLINKKLVKTLGWLAVPVISIFVLALLNVLFWNTHAEWKEYNEYNKARSEILDYVDLYPAWEEAEEQYKQCGLNDKNDLNLLFMTAFIGDSDVYSLETLQNIGKLKDENIPLSEKIQGMKTRVASMLKEGKVLICVFFLAFILYYGFNKKAFLPIGINLFCAFGFLIVFSYLGRMMLRVWEPTLLCMMGAIIVLFGNMRANDIEREYEIQLIYNPRDRKKTRYRSFLKFTVSDLFLGLLCCIIFLGSINVFSDLKSLSLPTYDVDRDEITRARAEFIDASRDEIYLLFFPLIHHPPQPGTFGLWEPLPADYCPNYFALTNWDATTPTNINRLKAYGIGNPVKALFERDDTYSDYDRNVFDFIRHHYGENITCSKVKNFKDEGLIVQYSQPILKENIKENVKSKVEIVKDEYLVYGGENGFHIKGSLDVKEDMDIKALYCNVQSEDGILSYRLNWSEERFEGIFLDVEDGSLDNQELYLVGKTENGEYFQLGDIELESRE